MTSGRVRGAARWTSIACVAVLSMLAVPGAHAATQIGETFTAAIGGCTGSTYLQTASSGPPYSVPFDGVITSWSHQANANPTELKLKVARQIGPDTFLIVGESALKTPAPNQLNTFTDVQIPVRAGDVIGMFMAVGNSCAREPPGTWVFHQAAADVPPGASATFLQNTSAQFNLAATVEEDCDGDGLGDETQDADLVACDSTIPSVAITKGPKDKTKKKTATFEFTGADARAVAGFQCSLDGAAFAPCASPHTVKVKKGKHSFQVRAVDQNGNASPPARDDWKRKKKRKKK